MALNARSLVPLVKKQIYSGDVTDVRTMAWNNIYKLGESGSLLLFQVIKNHLIVAYGAMRNGKKDMGDIFAIRSKDDGDTWESPIVIFDHTKRQGDVQFCYANPVFYQAPGQDIIWCFCMRSQRAAKSEERRSLQRLLLTAVHGTRWKWPCFTQAHLF